MSHLQQIESTLLGFLQNQKQLYAQLIPTATAANHKLNEGESVQEELESINNVMENVRELDHQMAPLRQTVNQSNTRNPKLADLKKEITDLIQQLVAQTNALEEKIKSARDGLLPTLSEHGKKSKMHRAYTGQ